VCSHGTCGQQFLLTEVHASGAQILHQLAGSQTAGMCTGKISCTFEKSELITKMITLHLRYIHVRFTQLRKENIIVFIYEEEQYNQFQ
jgi:hypothetical protein